MDMSHQRFFFSPQNKPVYAERCYIFELFFNKSKTDMEKDVAEVSNMTSK
jgi:hypothetical protein